MRKSMVEASLRQALNAYNSTNRMHYPLKGHHVSNLEAVEYYLSKAIPYLPNHLGLALTIANMQSFRGEITKALHSYHDCLATARSDTERSKALTYLTVWYHYEGKHLRVEHYLKELRHISYKDETNVRALLKIIVTILSAPKLPEEKAAVLPPNSVVPYLEPSARHAIIALGYMLNDDGSMAPLLIQRLELTLQLAYRHTDSLIIVTGGLAKQGKTESQQMKGWLIERGVKPERIIEEDQATNTIDNAKLSLALLKQHKIQSATLISASIHVHRSHILFETLQRDIDFHPIKFNHLAVKDGLSNCSVPTGQIRRNCYIDALRGFGLPAFNCEPLVQI
ncbi:YdcF family protein [Photobacterium chitinilyticum]|uniref:YdcF family protein n=1 Tax=Photobacterium chitinilyticum TaxID=2485123 RepID=A0A444JNI3_9GAMM|nr:YdcF family protein [Photobacterium chitinilyticum]RWX54634.1 YdcF family protein [Photobacterium chitinilyticum]